MAAIPSSSLIPIPYTDHDPISDTEATPHDTCLLRELNEHALGLLSAKKFPEFVHLVLSGNVDGEAVELAHELLSDYPFCFVERFYGTIVGITTSVHVHNNFTLNPSCTWAHSFREAPHVTWSWETDGVSRTELINNIPNGLIGTFDNGTSLYFMLPSLASSTEPTSRVSTTQFREIWDSAIIPSLVQLGYRTGQRRIRAEDVAEFSRLVHHNANSQLPHLKDEFLFVIISDTTSTFHTFNFESMVSALIEHLRASDLCLDNIRTSLECLDRWYIDTGFRVLHQDKSTVWRIDSHENMLAALVEGFEDVDWEAGPRHRKTFAHMTDAGCTQASLLPEPLEPGYELPTFASLTVDEPELRAADERSNPVESLTVLDLIHQPDFSESFLSRLRELYDGRRTAVHARATVTTPIYLAFQVVLLRSARTALDSCYVFDVDDIWTWRSLRVKAMDYLLDLQKAHFSSPHSHLQDGLVLTATLAWLVNTLHTGTISDIEGVLPMSSSRGVMFLRPIHIPGTTNPANDVPRFARLASTVQATEVFIRLLGDTRTAVIASFSEPNPRLLGYQYPLPAPHGPLPSRITMVSLSSSIPSVYSLPFTWDPDILFLSHGPIPTEDPYIASFNEVIVDAFISSILVRAPTATIRSIALLHTKEDVRILMPNLANVFNSVRWKHASQADWNHAFSRLFPPKNVIRAGLHPPYTPCKYYEHWIYLAGTLSDYSFRLLRRAIYYSFFQQLYWVPFPSDERIWSTQDNRRFNAFSDDAPDVPFVNILINGPVNPVYDPSTVIF